MDPLTFYFDRCLGKKLPQAITSLRPPFTIMHQHCHECRFHQAMPDDEWLHIVGEKGWVVISHDGRMHQEEASLIAMRQHRIACFYLAGGNLDKWSKLRILVRNLDRMKEAVQTLKRPFIFRVREIGPLQRIDLSKPVKQTPAATGASAGAPALD